MSEIISLAEARWCVSAATRIQAAELCARIGEINFRLGKITDDARRDTYQHVVDVGAEILAELDGWERAA